MENSENIMIFDIKRFAIHDGPGIRTTIFFKGCPLRCWWCHNPESQSFSIQKTPTQTFGRKISCDDLYSEIKKDQIFFEESHGGVTFSGGEPIAQFEVLRRIAKICTHHGIHTSLDTCGYIEPERFRTILPYINTYLYDIKLVDPESHQKYTGVSMEWITQNLFLLNKKKREIIIRIPIIPEINTSKSQISHIINFLQDFDSIQQVDLLPYHSIAKYKYEQLDYPYKMKNIPEPTLDQMNTIQQQFQSQGFSVKIGG